MQTDFYAFGEILWDCLPSGRHAGGAPFNVTAHLAQLGATASLISSIGQDQLGDEILEVARNKGVNTEFITRARIGLPTGTVLVTLDANSNASYELVQPVAWDEIRVPQPVLDALAKARGLIFGSLACRSLYNIDQLDRLLAVEGPLKCFDVNLRPPFVDLDLVLRLVQRSDLVKMNNDEVGLLASWVRTGAATPNTPVSSAELAEACAVIAGASGAKRICITLGANGAAFWEASQELRTAPAPHVEVKDTVGAGDAFVAGLMVGLARGTDKQAVLQNAGRLGAFVASHYGATPILPAEIVNAFR